MVRSNVCPRCLGELSSCYIEEGDLIISDEEVVCPHCGFRLKGALESPREENDNPRSGIERAENSHGS